MQSPKRRAEDIPRDDERSTVDAHAAGPTREGAPRWSELRYRRLVEHLPDPVFVQVDERIVYANPAAATLLGASGPAALIGRSVVDLAEPGCREQVRARLRTVVETGQPPGRAEQRFLRLDGRGVVHVESTAMPFTFQGRPAVLSIRRDITERKRLEARLIQAEKLEVVAQLGARVAHDFNNLLTALIANADMLHDQPGDRLLVRAGAREIRDAALRGVALTRQLMFSSRRDVLRPVEVELSAIVSREEAMLRRLLGDRVHLHVMISPNAGEVHADPDQFGQILLNLVVNARDAMPAGGVVAVETNGVHVWPGDEGGIIGLAPGAYATLTVRDTGVGMSAETKAHIFEPFFTTKGPGHGTGLGLAIVDDVVRDAGGAIAVESTPGQGSAFTVYWPCREPAR